MTSDATADGTFRIHALIHGLVQGVGFRYSAMRVAEGLGVTGWARNRFDGTVEVEAQGTREAVRSFIAWLRHGPRWAHVTAVDVSGASPVADDRGFRPM